MNMGDIIKELRIKNNLTQEELGLKIGVKKSAINKYEKGNVQNLKRSTIQKLAIIFDVSPTFLMGLEDEKQDENIFAYAPTHKIPILGCISAGLPLYAVFLCL